LGGAVAFFGEGLLLLELLDFLDQAFAGDESVAGTRAGFLAADVDVESDVAQLDAGVGFVDLLAAGAFAEREALDEILILHAQVGEAAVDLGEWITWDLIGFGVLARCRHGD